MATLLAGFLLLASGFFFIKFLLWLSMRGNLRSGEAPKAEQTVSANIEWTYPMDDSEAPAFYPEGRTQTQMWNPETKQWENPYTPSEKLADRAIHNDTYRLDPFAKFMKDK